MANVWHSKIVNISKFLCIQYRYSNIKVALMTQDKFQENESADFKSKTQIKNEMQDLQKLGKKLVELGNADLAKMPLSSDLADAINLAHRINKKKEGYRRQLQFVGKLIRNEDIQSIEDALHKLQLNHQGNNEAFHKLEKLRDDLLVQGDPLIHEVCQTYPSIDNQKLRQLTRQAKKEKDNDKPPKSSREMFKYLRLHISP